MFGVFLPSALQGIRATQTADTLLSGTRRIQPLAALAKAARSEWRGRRLIYGCVDCHFPLCSRDVEGEDSEAVGTRAQGEESCSDLHTVERASDIGGGLNGDRRRHRRAAGGLADRDPRTRTSHKTRCSRQVFGPLLRNRVNGGLPFLPSSIRRNESKAVAAGRNADRCIE